MEKYLVVLQGVFQNVIEEYDDKGKAEKRYDELFITLSKDEKIWLSRAIK